MATKKAAKRAAKKSPRKAAPRKRAAQVTAAPAATAAGKKGAKVREFAYMVSTPVSDDKGSATTKREFYGPFASEANALDDAGLMSEGNSEITLYRSVKKGTIQKTARFAASK